MSADHRPSRSPQPALPRLLVLPTLALALGACSQTPNTNPPPSGNAKTVLVYGTVSSPVADELKQRFTFLPYTPGTEMPGDDQYDLVLLDGDAFSVQNLKNDAFVARTLRSGKWLLAVDVTEAQKQQGLGEVLGAGSGGNSPGYFVRTLPSSGSIRDVYVVDYPRSAPVSATGTHTRPVGSAASAQPAGLGAASLRAENADATSAFLQRVTERLGSPKAVGLATPLRPQDAPSLPASVFNATYYYNQPITAKAPPANANYPVKDRGQVATLDVNYTFRVILDNGNNPQGDFQWVAVDIDGTANPTGGSGGTFQAINNDEKAWISAGVFQNIYPGVANQFTAYASGPETKNNVTQVTTSVGFTVGYTQQGADPSPSASFSYSRSETRDLSDWKVTNDSADTVLAWFYRSQNPMDTDRLIDPNPNVFPDNAFTWLGEPKTPNDLNVNQMQWHSQAVYKTSVILNQPTSFGTNTNYYMGDLFCGDSDPSSPCFQPESTWVEYDTPGSFQLDMGAVVPAVIQSITFNPNPVRAGQAVTGTVTLQAPARADTVIQLSSNTPLVVPPASITILKGQTSGTFVATTASSGAPGSTYNATITAIYARNYQGGFTVQN